MMVRFEPGTSVAVPEATTLPNIALEHDMTSVRSLGEVMQQPASKV